MPGPAPKWTRETCKQSALKYQSKKDWRAAEHGAYQAAFTKGYLSECTEHMPEHAPASHFVYTFESCFKSALNYTSRIEWFRGDKGAYQAASRHGWIRRCCSHMPRAQNRGGRPRIKMITRPGGRQYKRIADKLMILIVANLRKEAVPAIRWRHSLSVQTKNDATT